MGVTTLKVPAGPSALRLSGERSSPIPLLLQQHKLGSLREPSVPPLAPSQAILPGRETFVHLLRTTLSFPFGYPYRDMAPEDSGLSNQTSWPVASLPLTSPQRQEAGSAASHRLCRKSTAHHLEKEFPPPHTHQKAMFKGSVCTCLLLGSLTLS